MSAGEEELPPTPIPAGLGRPGCCRVCQAAPRVRQARQFFWDRLLIQVGNCRLCGKRLYLNPFAAVTLCLDCDQDGSHRPTDVL